jgi:hypothetical protein
LVLFLLLNILFIPVILETAALLAAFPMLLSI